MEGRKTVRLIVVAVVLLSGTAVHATPPFYDPPAYCHRATRLGVAEQTYGTCYRQEQAAYDRIKIYWDGLTVGARAYCDAVAETIGGSDQVLEICLQQQRARDQENRPPKPSP